MIHNLITQNTRGENCVTIFDRIFIYNHACPNKIKRKNGIPLHEGFTRKNCVHINVVNYPQISHAENEGQD